MPQQVGRSSVPYHLFDEEVEDEFVCSMVRAAQRVEGNTADWAAEYFAFGIQIQPDDLCTPRAKSVYETLLKVVRDGGVPSWGILRSCMLEAGQFRDARTRLSYLLGMSTGLISAIPTLVARLQELARQRAEHAA